jgi:hypothetical protein
MVPPPQRHQIMAKLAHPLPARLRTRVLPVHPFEDHRVAPQKPRHHLVRQRPLGRFRQFRRVVHDPSRRFQRFLLLLPLPVAAPSPFRQVLLADMFPLELPVDDSLDFRQRIQPCQQRCARFPVVQPAIDLLPDLLRQPRDFSISAHIFYWSDLPGLTRTPSNSAGLAVLCEPKRDGTNVWSPAFDQSCRTAKKCLGLRREAKRHAALEPAIANVGCSHLAAPVRPQFPTPGTWPLTHDAFVHMPARLPPLEKTGGAMVAPIFYAHRLMLNILIVNHSTRISR